MQPTVALSDAVLAAVCFFAVFQLRSSRFRLSAVPGFFLVGLAAALGVIRYALYPDIQPLHSLVSTMAGLIGMPLLGLAFIVAGWRPLSVRHQVAAIFVLAILFVLFHYLVPFKLYGTVIGGLAMVIVIVTGLKHVGSSRDFAVPAIIGGLLVIVAGLGLRGPGELGGVLRVNWYHYALAMAMMSLYLSLAGKKN